MLRGSAPSCSVALEQHTCIIDEDVELAELGHGLLHHLVCIRLNPDVPDDEAGLSPSGHRLQLGHASFQLLSSPSGDDHSCPGLDQHFGDLPADAGAAAGHLFRGQARRPKVGVTALDSANASRTQYYRMAHSVQYYRMLCTVSTTGTTVLCGAARQRTSATCPARLSASAISGGASGATPQGVPVLTAVAGTVAGTAIAGAGPTAASTDAAAGGDAGVGGAAAAPSRPLRHARRTKAAAAAPAAAPAAAAAAVLMHTRGQAPPKPLNDLY